MKQNEELQILEKIYIPYDSQFIVIKKINTNYELIELYKLRKESKMIHLNFGYYDNELSYPESRFYDRRINLKGLHFSLALSVVGIRVIYKTNAL